ncbi:MAG: hypothetical protein C5B54_11365 [Acidobacteria bacterium]|nr:MAG: hypothetical protein C5B54_11365 [Acidobacteriota bacterium]
MKKLFWIILFGFLVPLKAHAFQSAIWLSSNTAIAVSTTNIIAGTCDVGPTNSVRAVLHGICINTPATGSVTVWNSSATQTNLLATYSTTSAVPCNFYDVYITSGITINKNGTADVTLLYNCY